MKVFVTGAPGFIGQAVVSDLVKNGHEAIGLARSDASADKVTKAGGQVHRGDLEDLESLKAGAKAAHGVIHLAFIHDFSEEGFKKALAVDQAAIQAMGDAMEGSGKPLVIAAGTLIVAGSDATEDTPAKITDSVFTQRGKAEILVQTLSKEKNIRGSVIRLSPTVHGAGDQGFVTILSNMARGNGFATNVNDGSTRWPAVHRLDAAVLFRLALEKGKAGAIYHGAAELVKTGQINEKIGQKLNLPVEGKSFEEAMKAVGFFGMILGTDNPVSSQKTQEELGWKPTQPDLLADMDANYQW